MELGQPSFSRFCLVRVRWNQRVGISEYTFRATENIQCCGPSFVEDRYRHNETNQPEFWVPFEHISVLWSLRIALRSLQLPSRSLQIALRSLQLPFRTSWTARRML